MEPTFVNGAAGELFAIYHPPIGNRSAESPALIYLPPFAEEMNRSRRMAALQARALAEQGCGVLLLDPFGCGDSAGDFADSRWEIWRGDVIAAAAWLQEHRHGRLSLLGLRLGALLALDVSPQLETVLDRVLLWQPVLSGESLITQFLRIRLAAGIGGAKAAESTTDLRRRLKDGESIEVAGYMLSSALVRRIDELRLQALGRQCPVSIEWIEVTSDPTTAPPPAQQQIAEQWRQEGVDFRVTRVAGEPFWSLQETTLAPALLQATTELFRN